METVTLAPGSPHLPYFEVAADYARQATCFRARCGSIVVSNDFIIGTGFNAPASTSNRRCDWEPTFKLKPKSDRTCCVHAEWNAILNAAINFPDLITGSILYFMRVDENGDATDASEPYCTVCSRLTLAAGVARFALYRGSTAAIYDSDKYDDISARNLMLA